MDEIRVESGKSPDGDEYHMFWLTEGQKQRLMDVLAQAKLWLPDDDLKRRAAYLFVDIGSQLGCVSKKEATEIAIRYAK